LIRDNPSLHGISKTWIEVESYTFGIRFSLHLLLAFANWVHAFVIGLNLHKLENLPNYEPYGVGHFRATGVNGTSSTPSRLKGTAN
jgi:hypothetical protein